MIQCEDGKIGKSYRQFQPVRPANKPIRPGKHRYYNTLYLSRSESHDKVLYVGKKPGLRTARAKKLFCNTCKLVRIMINIKTVKQDNPIGQFQPVRPWNRPIHRVKSFGKGLCRVKSFYEGFSHLGKGYAGLTHFMQG